MKGKKAFQYFINAFQDQIDTKNYGKSLKDFDCIEYDGQTDELIAIIDEVSDLYQIDTYESLLKIYRKDYPEILELLLVFTKTECGQSVFSPEAIAKIENSQKILKTT